MAAYVHVGQCGNQLGAAYWQLVAAGDRSASSADASALAKPPRNKLRKPLVVAPTSCSTAATAASSSTKQPSAASPLFTQHFYLRQSHRARCVLVDTEPKVVAAALAGGAFQPAFAHIEQSGRGNNWAMGYNFQRFQRNVIPSRGGSGATAPITGTTSHARKLRARRTLSTHTALDTDERELTELALESLQKVVEATDCFQGTVLLHSLGGGTGAGLGSRLIERIRDAYPRAYLFTVSVAPSWRCGDTPLQNYNSVFTLAHLHEFTDCVIYKENDELLRTVAYWKTMRLQQDGADATTPPTQHRVSIAELNQLAAADLAGLLFPTVANFSALGASVTKPFDFGTLVRELCPMPAAKFLDVRTGVLRAKAPSSHKTAADPLFHADVCSIPLAARRSDASSDIAAVANKLFRHTAQSFPRSSYAALASRTIVRGFSVPENAVWLRSLETAARAAFPGVAWQPEYASSVSSSPDPPFAARGGKASATIAVNNGHVLASAEQYLERAQRQFRARAYVHWYMQHGLEESDFHEAFDKCERLASGYKELLK